MKNTEGEVANGDSKSLTFNKIAYLLNKFQSYFIKEELILDTL